MTDNQPVRLIMDRSFLNGHCPRLQMTRTDNDDNVIRIPVTTHLFVNYS